MSDVANAAPVAASTPADASIEAKSIESNESSDLDDGLADDVSASADDSAKEKKDEKKEIKKRISKLKLKFNGKEVEEELPFEIDDDPKAIEFMQKQLQMAKLGNSKAQEYADLEKTVTSFLNELKTNPRKALSNPNIGVDLKKMAAEILEEEIANSQKSPELIEREKLEAKLRELEDEKKTKEEEFRTRELERLQEAEVTRYDTLMSQALEKSDLPKSPYVVKKMADIMIAGLNKGMDLQPADVLPIVREEILSDIKSMFGVMPAEVLKEVIGKDNLDKIRKHNMSKAKEKPPVTTSNLTKDVGHITKDEKKDDKKVSYKDFFGGGLF